MAPQTSDRAKGILDRYSLTGKMMVITFIVGILVWSLIGYIQSRKLEGIFIAQLKTRLDMESMHDRMSFDMYIRTFSTAVKLFATMKNMNNYISLKEQEGWATSKETGIKLHRNAPPWYPRSSVARTLVSPDFAMLLDPSGRIREAFIMENDVDLVAFPTERVLSMLSHNNIVMTNIMGKPYIISASAVADVYSSPKAFLVLASPLDSDLLKDAQSIHNKFHITALVSNDDQRVIASTNSEALPEGIRLDDMEDLFLVTGKSFFDYGVSDLLIQFATLMSTSEIKSLSGEIHKEEIKQKAFLSLALILSFGIVMYSITGRISRLTRSVVDFSRDNLGLMHEDMTGGDQIVVLEEQFSRLEAGIVEAKAQLMKTNMELMDKNAELEEALVAAQAANKAKGEFLANMSHELRTPLSGIIGITELLLETELTEHQRDFLSTVQSSADSLRVIINDILDISKIAARKLELYETPFRIRQMFDQSTDPLAVLAIDKGISLVFAIQPDVPEFLYGDASRLRQILNNLIGNAIKFTDEGGVCMQLDTVSRSEDDATLHFQVTDTGIGIPEDSQEEIFESFAQADGSSTRKYGGTGLGLAISSELVELMGGKLMLESAPGKGSRFHFTLTMKVAGQEPTDEETDRQDKDMKPALPPMRVLLAEDNGVNRMVAIALLNRDGHEVRTVDNGKDAVKLSEDGNFDLILMDVMMPGMDGLEATRLIRERERSTGRHIPIIAMTAKAMAGDRDKCIEAGMDEYISKPIRFSDLQEKMRACSRHTGSQQDKAGPDRPPAKDA